VRSFGHWRGRVFDVLVVAVAVAALVEIVLADLPRARLLMPAVVLYTLPLLLRDRWPFAMPVLVIVVQVLVSFLDVPGGARENWSVVAYVLAFWALGAYNPLGAAVAGLGAALAGVVVVTFEDVRVPADEAFSVALVGSLTWLAGVVLRRRSLLADQAEQRAAAFERDHRDTETAVAEERARIAREVHDVVAHSVSVMTVQAGAARMLLTTDPQRAVAPLLAVEEAGRQASARPLATHIECAFPRLGRVSFASPPRARIQRLQRDLAPPGRRRPHSSPRLPRLVTPCRRRDAPGMPTCGSPTDDGTHAGTPSRGSVDGVTSTSVDDPVWPVR
jgi:Histidine kinase